MDSKIDELNHRITQLDSDNSRLKQLIVILEQMSIDLMPVIIKCKCDHNSDKLKTKLNVLKQKYEFLKENNSLNNNNFKIIDKIKSCAKIAPKIVIKKEVINFDENISENELTTQKVCNTRRRGRPPKVVTNAANNSLINEENDNTIKDEFDCNTNDVNKKSKVSPKTRVQINRENGLKLSKKVPKIKIKTETKTKVNKTLVKAKRNELKVICDWPQCGKRFRDTYELKFHMWRHTGKKLYRCDWPGCHKEFSSRYLKKHHKSHLDPKRFHCLFPECKQSFESSADLNQHFVDEHNGDKPFKCDFADCGQQFTNKPNLIQHQNWCHSDICFKCEWPGCDDSFKRKHLLKDHIDEKHIGIGKSRYVCDWPGCEFKSGHSKSFKRHKMVHTGEKPYPCDWSGCEWKFRQQHQLKAHMLTHTGEAPVSCEITGCNMKFKTRRVMRAHAERVHNISITLKTN